MAFTKNISILLEWYSHFDRRLDRRLRFLSQNLVCIIGKSAKTAEKNEKVSLMIAE